MPIESIDGCDAFSLTVVDILLNVMLTKKKSSTIDYKTTLDGRHISLPLKLTHTGTVIGISNTANTIQHSSL